MHITLAGLVVVNAVLGAVVHVVLSIAGAGIIIKGETNSAVHTHAFKKSPSSKKWDLFHMSASVTI
jgi:hypothetical protein